MKTDISSLAPVATPEEPTWPDDLAPEAFHGVIGEIVRKLEPHTEADPAALHFSILTLAGNAIGRGPYFPIEGDKHRTNLNVGIVGTTAGGKGVSLGRAKQVVTPADPEWAKTKFVHGVATGEGMIWNVRDPIEERRQAKDDEMLKADEDGMITEIVDPGVIDKRMMVLSSEFAQTLTAANRDNNTLSAIMRQLWDNGCAESLVRNAPYRTTGAFVSVIAHITPEELAKKLTVTESANGFANRFAWVLVKKARLLPFGGDLTDEDLAPLIEKLTMAIWSARRIGEMGMSLDAQRIWSAAYVNELTIEHEGMFGAITGRAHAISLRLCVLFAALDGSHVIEVPHVEAALATWRRAEQSAAYLFGGSTGDRLMDRIKSIIVNAGQDGIRRGEIRAALGSNNFNTERISHALGILRDKGIAHAVTEETAGRPAERWIASDIDPITPINPTVATPEAA